MMYQTIRFRLPWIPEDFKMELVEGFDRGSVNYVNLDGGWFGCFWVGMVGSECLGIF